MGNSPETFGGIVGALAVIRGIELIGADVVFVGVLIGLDQAVVIGLDVLVRDGFAVEQEIRNAVCQAGFNGVVHVFLDIGGFVITVVQQHSFRVGAGGGLVVLGGAFSQGLGNIGVQDALPFRLCGQLHGGLLFIRDLVQAELRGFLADQDGVDGVVQGELADGFEHARIAGIIAALFSIVQIIGDHLVQVMVIGLDFLSVHGNQQHGGGIRFGKDLHSLRGGGFRLRGGGSFFRQGEDAGGEQHKHHQDAKQTFDHFKFPPVIKNVGKPDGPIIHKRRNRFNAMNVNLL